MFSSVTSRILAMLLKSASDVTARRRRSLYKDRFWTSVELLEDRTLLSGILVGGGQNQPPAQQAVPSSPPIGTDAPVTAIATGDLNGDGHADVVAGLVPDAQGQSQLYIGLNVGGPNPTFTQLEGLQTTGGVLDIALADLDQDGDLDIVTASSFENGTPGVDLRWWENRLDLEEGFVRHDVESRSDRTFARIAVGDVDGDQDVDVVAAFSVDENAASPLDVLWYENRYDSNEQRFDATGGSVAAAAGGQVVDVELADIDGDGDVDVLVALNAHYDSEYVEGYYIDGDYIQGEYVPGGYVEGHYEGEEYVEGYYQEGYYLEGYYEQVYIEGYEIPEFERGIVLAISNSGSSVNNYLSFGTQLTSTDDRYTSMSVESARRIDEQTIDGFDLLLTTSPGASGVGQIVLLSDLNPGTGQFANGQYFDAPGETVAYGVFGDVDGDGDRDLVGLFEVDGFRQLAWYSNLGDGAFADRALLGPVPGDVTTIAAAFASAPEGQSSNRLDFFAVGEAVPGEYVSQGGGDYVALPDTGRIQTYVIRPAQTASIAVSGQLEVDEGGSTPVTGQQLQATGFYADPDAIEFTLTAAPLYGELRLGSADAYEVLTENSTFTQADVDAGRLTYVHGGDEFFSDSFRVTASDGTATTDEATIAIAVNPINDAPSGADATVTTLEDTPYTFTVEDFGFSDASDSPANEFLAVTITAIPSRGSLTLDGVAVTEGQSVSVSDVAAGLLLFTPGANRNGAGYASFTFQVQDDGGTDNGGVDLDPVPRTMTIDVTTVNDAPSGADRTVTTLEDTPYAFTVEDFGFTDVSDSPVNAFSALTITTLPSRGSLTLDGVAVTEGQSVSVSDVAAGLLQFAPRANDDGAGYASFTFQVQDDGGTEDGGVELDPVAKTITIDVTSVNDAPSGDGHTVRTLEDTPYTFSVEDFGFSDESDSPANELLAVTITTLPSAGSLTLDGVAVTEGQSVSASDVAAGLLQFAPGANDDGAGYASFTFQVQDDGGTDDGGFDLDPVPRTMTIDVTTVNDAPSGADRTVTTLEDTPYVFTVEDFGFTDVSDSPVNAFSAVTITTLPSAGSLTLDGVALTEGQSVSVSDVAAGLLQFAPGANDDGAGYASFTFQVQDDGGTDDGGFDLDPVAKTITIDVTPVNDAPAGAERTVTTLEDTPYVFTLADFGFTDPDDSPADAFLAVTVVTVPSPGTLTLDGVTVTAGQSVSVSDIVAGRLRFAPVTNANGAGYASFTFQVQDNGGTDDGGVDLDPVARTMTIDVTSVNDAPSGVDRTVTTLEDTPYVFTVADFGFTDVSDSPVNEFSAVTVTTLPSAGTLTLGGAAVSAGQSVSVSDIAAGRLRFAPATNANGDGYASFTFRVQDDGGVANGGVDLDPVARTMTIDVTSVNDAPVGTSRTVTTLEDTAYVFTLADFGYTDPSDSPTNAFAAVTISSLPTFGTLTLSGEPVAEGQSVSVADVAAGRLVFRPVPNAPQGAATGFGYSMLTFQVQDDGGTDNGGVDVDPTPRQITINVTPVADTPVLTTAPATGREDTSIALTVTNSLTDTDGSETLSLVINGIPAGAIVTDGQFTSTAGATSWNVSGWNLQNLRITPPLNFNGEFTLTLTSTATERQNPTGLGVASTTRSLTVTVLPDNDAPVVSPTDEPTIDQAQSFVVDLRPFLTDVETDPDDFVFDIIGVTGGYAEISEDGNYAIFIPDPDFVGIATFTYTATDDGDRLDEDPDDSPRQTITRTGTISVRVLRYQDLGDAPESYGTIAPDQDNPGPNGARHGGSHLNPDPVRLGATVGYGETNGQPSEAADGDDRNGGDDEDGMTILTGLEGRNDRDLVRTLRIDAPAGGRLDAWIDFNRNGTFDENERVQFSNNRRAIVREDGTTGLESTFELDGTSLVLHEGVNFVDVVIPRGSVDFTDTVVAEDGTREVTRSEVTTYARFRVSTLGHLNANGFAFDGEVEDYRVTIGNRNPPPGQPDSPGFDAAIEIAARRFIEAYADELIADPNYVPDGSVPFVYNGAGDGGDAFQRGETDEALNAIIAEINAAIARDRGTIENVFVFVTHPVDYVVTDPQGRQAGHTEARGTFNEIGSNVQFSGDGAVELLVIRNASAGEYQIDFVGVGGVFRGGASLLTAAGTQQSTFQGGLGLSQAVALSLEYTAPVIGVGGAEVAQAGGRGQAFFNITDDNGEGDDDDALSALSGLDAENDSGDLEPREQILRWIEAVRTNSKALRRVLLDEFEPAWLTEVSPEAQLSLDEFWTGLGQSMLGGIPGQVFQLGEFLGVEVPLLFAPETPESDSQQVKDAAGDEKAVESGETSSVEAGSSDVAANRQATGDAVDGGMAERAVALATGDDRSLSDAARSVALAARRSSGFGRRDSRLRP